MKRLIIFLQIIAFPVILNGQKLIYENLDSLLIGFYKDFEEFKYNNPSIHFSYNDYKVIVKERGYGLFNSDGHVTYYKMKLAKDNLSTILNSYGFCDGNHVFLNVSSFPISLKAEFVKIEYIGLYSYFESVSNSSSVNVMNNEPYSPFSNINMLSQQVINIIDGKVITLNKSNLRRLIEPDKELSTDFENEDNKNDILKEYVIKYSEKHKNEYNPPIEIEIDSLIFKLDSDSTFEDYYNRVLSYASNTVLLDVELRTDYFGNDQVNFIGLKAKNKNGANQDYFYKIGTWRFFYKNGQLKELINYDLMERKHGLYLYFDEQGNLVEEKTYRNNNLIQ